MEVFFIYLFMGCLAAYALYLVFRGRNRGVCRISSKIEHLHNRATNVFLP